MGERAFFLFVVPFISAAVGAAECNLNQRELGPEWKRIEIARVQVVANIQSRFNPRDPSPKNFAAYKDKSMCSAKAPAGTCAPDDVKPDAILSGTFHDGTGYVMAPLVRKGILEAVVAENVKYYGRGAFAALSDGTFSICRPAEVGGPVDTVAIEEACSNPGAVVRDMMGGGGLLIFRGRKVCSSGKPAGACEPSADLDTVQHFNSNGVGIDAGQFRSATHTVAAIRGGRAYLLWNTTKKSGRQVQSDLCAAGFGDAVKFDGGAGFFMRSRTSSLGDGSNPSGFLIKARK